MECLHMLISRAIHSSQLHGLQIGNGDVTVSHLFYADDAIFLKDWNARNVLNIVLLLQYFFLVSCLKINFAKCRLMGVGVPIGKINEMANIIGCEASTIPFVEEPEHDATIASNVGYSDEGYNNMKNISNLVISFQLFPRMKVRLSCSFHSFHPPQVRLGPSVYSCSTKDGPSSEHQVSSVSSNLQRPPSIDNSDFISRSAYENSPELEIYDTLVEGTDYILVPEKMWNLFYKWMLVVVLYERLDVINASTAKNTQLRY
ncbi:RNA-directed DNA polymerase, eukaryota [Tanacetum coccineum]|uniref:RNA-directed DNA polymerase, eukaryota n=1 Tax=Tanacetum coccineum TaxID=301880 RepID=A0ABQ5I5L2_9ASTR